MYIAITNEFTNQKSFKLRENDPLGFDSAIRVVNVKDVEISKAPYMAALKNKDGEVLCGRAITSKRGIATAAHCLDFGLSFGVEKCKISKFRFFQLRGIGNIEIITEVRVGSKDCKAGGQVIEAEKFIVHKKYDSAH